MKVDRDGFVGHKNQLEGMQQNQSSLISDLRACFETYTSIQEKFPDFQLKTHGKVLTALLGILKVSHLQHKKESMTFGNGISENFFLSHVPIPQEQMSLTDTLDVGKKDFDEIISQLDVLLQDKLLQISELSECFQSESAFTSMGPEPCKSSEGPEVLLEESFRIGKENGNISDDSFEDLRA